MIVMLSTIKRIYTFIKRVKGNNFCIGNLHVDMNDFLPLMEELDQPPKI